MKRFTVNFRKPFEVADNKEAEAVVKELKEKHVPYNYDYRNDIYCINPSYDFVMLHHYVEYLNTKRNEWTNFGRFDMGMVPIEMWPNFQQEVRNYADRQFEWRNFFIKKELPVTKMRAVSFLKPAYATAYGYDYWVFRDDMFEFLKDLNRTSNIHVDNLTSPDQPLFKMYLDAWYNAFKQQHPQVDW